MCYEGVSNVATIIDGMGLVQKARDNTFQDFSKQLFSSVLNVAAKSDRFDAYLKSSIKRQERGR